MTTSRLLSFATIKCHIGLIALVSGLMATASAQITVDAPATLAGTIVNSPFYLQAESSTCDSAPTTSFGYSVDDGGTTYFGAGPIQTMVSITQPGSHTVYLRAYNGSGEECDSQLSINVGGGVTVSAPSLSAGLPGTFNLVASSPTCGGDTTHLMGYNVDSGSNTNSSVTSLNTLVASGDSSGSHILRVKAYSGSEYCETDIPFTVTGGIAAASGATVITGPAINTSAPVYSGIEAGINYTSTYNPCPSGSKGQGWEGATGTDLYLWQTQPDCGTVGNKTGSTTYPTTSELYKLNSDSRQYALTYNEKGGGVRWFNKLTDGNNPPFTSANSATHFLYDLYLYIAPGSNVGEIEMDVNHGYPDNHLYLIGVQCSLSNSLWQVTVHGSNGDSWANTSIPCTSSQITTGAWHHLQVLTHHDADGGDNIYYDEISVDGDVQNLTCNGGACQSTAESTSWGESIGPNFQLDGGATPSGGGYDSIISYVDNFNIWYW